VRRSNPFFFGGDMNCVADTGNDGSGYLKIESEVCAPRLSRTVDARDLDRQSRFIFDGNRFHSTKP
jgi:hypothetical protein